MGEYVMASTNKSRDIYVWERSQGSLVKILEGLMKELGEVKVQFMNTHISETDYLLITYKTPPRHGGRRVRNVFL
jgi:chorismate-pyruvate lyase